VGLSHPSIAPYGAFECNDGRKVLISIQSDREWRVFAAAFLNDESLGTDPCFATNVARMANREKTDAIVAAAFAGRTGDEAITALLAANIAFAEVNDMAGLSAHPHLRRVTVETPNGPVSYPAPAPIFDGKSRRFGPVPGLGEPQ
jgi:crotonobetainyl-CoA:carnitine CoA-transferase CaiB-like acyl-CoA transferase